MKKVLCIGDSLGLPRDGVPYEATWFYKLKKAFPDFDFIDKFQRGQLINMALRKFDSDYKVYAPNIVILEFGICDCAPRYINDNAIGWKVILKLLNKMGIESLFWLFLKKAFKRSANTVYTKPHFFEKGLFSLVKSFFEIGVDYIFIIQIPHVSGRAMEKSPFFNANIEKYNSIFSKLQMSFEDKIKLIDPLHNPLDEYYLSDGYHCKEEGMNKVYASLFKLFCDVGDMSLNNNTNSHV